MKSLMLGTIALIFTGSALAQSPKVLVHASGGDVQVAGHTVADTTSYGAEVGDEIVVTDGEAVITYANGCSVRVTGRHTVQAKGPASCPITGKGVSAEANYAMIGSGIVIAAGAAALAGGGGDDDKPSSP